MQVGLGPNEGCNAKGKKNAIILDSFAERFHTDISRFILPAAPSPSTLFSAVATTKSKLCGFSP
jgi:hypothetical protein